MSLDAPNPDISSILTRLEHLEREIAKLHMGDTTTPAPLTWEQRYVRLCDKDERYRRPGLVHFPASHTWQMRNAPISDEIAEALINVHLQNILIAEHSMWRSTSGKWVVNAISGDTPLLALLAAAEKEVGL